MASTPEPVRAYAEAYLNRVAACWGIKGLHINVLPEVVPPSDHAYATTMVYAGGRRAEVRLCHRYVALPPIVKAEKMVHEVVHMWLFPLTSLLTAGPLAELADSLEEDLVNEIAPTICRHIPWEGP